MRKRLAWGLTAISLLAIWLLVPRESIKIASVEVSNAKSSGE